MGANKASPPAGIEREIKLLAAQGIGIELIEHGGQWYALVRSLVTPAPPWGAATHDILIAVPMAYETAGLDAFYLRQPFSFNGSSHPRAAGAVIQVAGASWTLVSWHYRTDKNWLAGQDSLGSHIEHCRGFFLNRKAINAY